ncbi:nickel insertion protein, partial [Streptococcus anginosus]
MKKDRPGVLITVLTPAKDKESVAKILLKESSSFGVRYYDTERLILAREFTQVALMGGGLQLKIGYLDGKIIKV